MNKDALRKIQLSRRLALSDTEYQTLSQNISDLFFSSYDLLTINVLHVFIPIIAKREPDTWLIIDRVRREYPQVKIAIPRVNGNTMENILFEHYSQLEETKWGMTEPKTGKTVSPREIDMVLVPLLAFDRDGHRVGFGKGYYDKLLAECKPGCKKIGISFFEEVIIDDVNPMDRPLDQCITPREVVFFRD